MKRELLLIFFLIALAFVAGQSARFDAVQTVNGQTNAQNELAVPPLLAWGFIKNRDDAIRPESFPRDSDDDWSAAIEAAARAAMETFGNTVKFTCGKSYPIKRKLNLDGAAQVHFLGCGSDYEQQGKPATISYSGADDSAFSFRSSYGIRLERLKLEYTNPNFTGIFVDFRHSLHNPTADTAYLTIEDCTLTGTAQANQATLLAIDGSIITRIKIVHFFHGKVGIKGMGSPHANYSNIITIAECSFNLVDVGILDPSSNWHITTNAFEPNKEGKIRAVDSECTFCQVASGVTYHNNYHGDAQVQQDEPIAKFKQAAGLSITGNWWIIEAGASRAAITLDNCEGVSITGNRANTVKNFVESVGGTTRDVFIAGNQTTAQKLVLQTAQILGLHYFQYGSHGSFLEGVASNGEAARSDEDYGTSIGRISSLGSTNSFARIGILDSATGYLNRSLGYFAPSSNNNPHIFFTWDDSQWRNRFQIGDKNLSSVPITVPDDKYNPATWKNSLEVPTKKALHEALQAHLAEIQAIVESQKAQSSKPQ